MSRVSCTGPYHVSPPDHRRTPAAYAYAMPIPTTGGRLPNSRTIRGAVPKTRMVRHPSGYRCACIVYREGHPHPGTTRYLPESEPATHAGDGTRAGHQSAIQGSGSIAPGGGSPVKLGGTTGEMYGAVTERSRSFLASPDQGIATASTKARAAPAGTAEVMAWAFPVAVMLVNRMP